jgi:hypothetical protein
MYGRSTIAKLSGSGNGRRNACQWNLQEPSRCALLVGPELGVCLLARRLKVWLRRVASLGKELDALFAFYLDLFLRKD